MVNKWQRMETAPRDGSMFLAFCLRGDQASYMDTIWWHKSSNESFSPSHWRDGTSNEIRPTYWMPLPEPPTTEET